MDIGTAPKAASCTQGSQPQQENDIAPPSTVRMRPSSFVGLPSTVFFDYPAELKYQRNDASAEESLGSRKLRYDTHWERNCIKKAFVRAGYARSTKKWTALWSKHQSEDALRSLNCLQKVNHFPNSWCIGRKDRLLRLITAMKRLHGAEFDIHPDGYILPGEKDALLRQVHDIDSKHAKRKVREGLWICKPVSSSCGRGIRVLTREKLLKYLEKDKGKSVIMQRYIDNPYLINGKKFDLRIYVLVTGVDPMRVYVHSQGLTRISTSNYSISNTKDKFAHLTNYSINKDSDKFVEAGIDAETGGCDEFDESSFKWSLAAFKKYLEERTSRDVMEATFRRIDDLLVKTMIAAESEMTPRVYSDCPYRSNCYELFGCDVMLDSKLNPHLIEVNVSPSLMGSSPLDRQIKGLLVADMFHLVGLYPHDDRMLSLFSAESKSTAKHRARTPSAGRRRKNLSDVSSATRSGKGGTETTLPTNPFAFNVLSRMMSSQEGWRKNANPRGIDISALSAPGNEGVMLLLLSIEDEFDRCISTHFNRVHPAPDTCEHFVSLYRNPRFSDHLLARWLLDNGTKGPFRRLIPKHHFMTPTLTSETTRPTSASAASIPHRSPSNSRSHGNVSNLLFIKTRNYIGGEASDDCSVGGMKVLGTAGHLDDGEEGNICNTSSDDSNSDLRDEKRAADSLPSADNIDVNNLRALNERELSSGKPPGCLKKSNVNSDQGTSRPLGKPHQRPLPSRHHPDRNGRERSHSGPPRGRHVKAEDVYSDMAPSKVRVHVDASAGVVGRSTERAAFQISETLVAKDSRGRIPSRVHPFYSRLPNKCTT